MSLPSLQIFASALREKIYISLCCQSQYGTKKRCLPLHPFSEDWKGLRSFFSDWVRSQLCVKHGRRKRKTKLTTHTGGWQHATNEKQMCVRLQPMGEETTREHCMVAGRLEEIGCVAVGGRDVGVSGVRVNPMNCGSLNEAKGRPSAE